MAVPQECVNTDSTRGVVLFCFVGRVLNLRVVYKWPQASARNGPGVYFEFFSLLDRLFEFRSKQLSIGPFFYGIFFFFS